jgi:hypothetical protein
MTGGVVRSYAANYLAFGGVTQDYVSANPGRLARLPDSFPDGIC